MTRLIALTLTLFLAAPFARCLAAETPTQATPEAPAPNGNEMPLELFQKIKTGFDVMFGSQAGLLVAPNEGDVKAAEEMLRKDAASNKDVLLRALKSSQVLQRELAARALEYCGDKNSAVAALSAALHDDSEASVRRAAAAALIKMPDAAAVDALIAGLNDSADSVRGLSATALGAVKDPRATDPLLRVLANDQKPLVRMQAATALSKIKDAKALPELMKLMEAEKDERVKMAIAGAVRTVNGSDTAATEAVPTAGDAANELAALAKDMKVVEEKLRSDRHDQAVQTQGKDIEKKLAQLIEKLNKSGGSGSGSSSSQQQSQQQQQKQQQQGGGSQSRSLSGSEMGSAQAPTSINPASVATKTEAWAKLPAAQRDELLQAYREDVPERWRKRLEAYFLSIAAEEAREAEKDNK
jgi:hypothetical protein